MKEQNFKSLAYRPADPLVVLNACRRNLAAIKAHDFAAEYSALHGHTFPPETVMVPSLATGRRDCLMQSAADFNASLRAFVRRHEFDPQYATARERAMRPVLGQLRMIEAAIGCDLACRGAVAAWRQAVAA